MAKMSDSFQKAVSAKEEPPKSDSGISPAETRAYLAALLVNFVDQMGPQFTVPVLVTYSTWIGASLNTIALFATARGIAAMTSNIWMPMCSDKFGRKWIAFISVVGCSIGYATQGIAYKFRGENPADWGPACLVFVAGRFITGFFCGMQPVLQAYITELSMPNKTLVTQRLVIMTVASNVAGVALSPLAGLLAQFGLMVPFWACTVVGVGCMFFVPFALNEVVDIKGKQLDAVVIDSESVPAQPVCAREDSSMQEPLRGVETMEQQSRSFVNHEEERKRGSPFCDVVVILMFFAYFAVMVLVIGGQLFLMPILFQQESFGILGDTAEQFQENISKWVALASIPIGFFQVFVAIVLFVPVTKRFGDVPTILVAGLIGTMMFPVIGFFGDKVWKIALMSALLGCAFGFITPALGPVSARYGSAMYPKQMALVQGIPLVGLQLSNTVSQNMMAWIVGDLEEPRLALAYCVTGCFGVVFTVLFTIAASLAHARIDGITVKLSDDDVAALTVQRNGNSLVAGTPLGPPACSTPVLRRAISGNTPKPRR